MLEKIISGGQTGADQGGLYAAKQLGIATGGWMPKGYLTLGGARPDLAKYGLTEHTSAKYPARTRANVRDSDGTIRFAKKFYTPGEACTLNAIKEFGRPHIDVDIAKPRPVEEVRTWLAEHDIKILNVAGNTEKTAPGVEAFVTDYLVKVLRPEPQFILKSIVGVGTAFLPVSDVEILLDPSMPGHLAASADLSGALLEVPRNKEALGEALETLADEGLSARALGLLRELHEHGISFVWVCEEARPFAELEQEVTR